MQPIQARKAKWYQVGLAAGAMGLGMFLYQLGISPKNAYASDLDERPVPASIDESHGCLQTASGASKGANDNPITSADSPSPDDPNSAVLSFTYQVVGGFNPSDNVDVGLAPYEPDVTDANDVSDVEQPPDSPFEYAKAYTNIGKGEYTTDLKREVSEWDIMLEWRIMPDPNTTTSTHKFDIDDPEVLDKLAGKGYAVLLYHYDRNGILIGSYDMINNPAAWSHQWTSDKPGNEGYFRLKMIPNNGANRDYKGRVDLRDFAEIQTAWMGAGEGGDTDGDFDADLDDLLRFSYNWLGVKSF